VRSGTCPGFCWGFLVGAHQPAEASHICRKNGREVTFGSRFFQNCAPRPKKQILRIPRRSSAVRPQFAEPTDDVRQQNVGLWGLERKLLTVA
jgi:hypothetical protein